jgi:hypothetical protein
MGAIAFAPATAAPPLIARAPTAFAVTPVANTAESDNLELLVAAIVAEAATLKDVDRVELAAKVLALGGYETADGPAHDNERARLAIRLAARLSVDRR